MQDHPSDGQGAAPSLQNQQTQPKTTSDTITTNPPAAVQPAEPAPRWEDLGLSQAALDLIHKAGFKSPTPVQAESIPFAIAGHDVIASAQTGTGKTASFVLPMVEKFAGREGTYGIILSPTREIAQQTQATLELFGTPRGVRSIVMIGGVDMKIDAKAIQTYPQIIVATPGRLCDHLDRGNIWLDYIEMVVLDEADRMLDMGFSDQLSRVMEDVPSDRQTLLFSATFTPTVENLARRILHEPKRVAIGKPQSAAKSVDQRLLWMSEESKNRELRRLIREEKGSIIVFTRSKDKATRVWRSLHSSGVYDATYIHSDRLQSHREQALAEFKEGKHRVLIATDVAGRGIHVDAVAHVVNFDLPMEPEDYVHRIGRTGRAGETGHSTSFVTPSDRGMVKRIEALIGNAIRAEFAPDFRQGGESAGSSGTSGGPSGGRGEDRSRGGSSRSGNDRGRGGSSAGPSSSQGGQTRSGNAPAPQAPRPQGASNGPMPIGSGPRPVSAAPKSANSAPIQAFPSGPPMDDSDDGDDSPDSAAPGEQGPAGEGAPKRRRRRRGGRGGGGGNRPGGPGGAGPSGSGPAPQG